MSDTISMQEGNLIIARFMEVKLLQADNGDVVVKNKNGVIRNLREWTKYHSDWSWLMPVVEKIELTEVNEFTPYAVNIECSECEIKDYGGKDNLPIAYEEGGTKIQAVWKAVVAFIQWYNNQSK